MKKNITYKREKRQTKEGWNWEAGEKSGIPGQQENQDRIGVASLKMLIYSYS